MNKFKFCALLLAMFGITMVAHAIPMSINYQGTVESGDTAFDGTGYFRFSIVDSTGTTTYWSNDGNFPPTTDISLAVTDGLFDVILGQGMTALTGSVFDNDNIYLRVWFDDGSAAGLQLLTPDRQITAAGFAIKADDSDKVDGYDYSSSWPTSQSNIQSALASDFHNIGGTDDDVPESGDFGAAVDLDASGNVADDSHDHTSSTVTLASSDLSDSADLLYETELDSESELESQLVGVVNVFTDNDGALSDDDVTLTDLQAAAGNDFHAIGGTDDDTPDNDGEVPDNITINNQTLYAPTGNGNVGIGTSSPFYKLSIRQDTDAALQANKIAIHNRYTDGNTLQDYFGVGFEFLLGHNDWDSYNIGYFNIYRDSADDSSTMEFNTRNAGNLNLNQLILKYNGNVGIGTFSPEMKLDVNGSVKADSYYGNGSNLTGISSGLWTDAGSYINANNASTVVVTDTGNMGLGTTAPTERLDMAGGRIGGIGAPNSDDDAVSKLYVDASVYPGGQDNQLLYNNNGVEAGADVWYDSSTEYVGIGTGLPTRKLTVIGPVQATTYYGDGSNLTGIAGMGIWADAGTYIYPENATDIVITDAGNMGVGVTDPTHKLTVQSSISFNTLRLIGPYGTYGFGARISFGDGDYAYLEEDLDDSLKLYASRISLMNGDVGIGTSYPTSKLEVAGTIHSSSGGIKFPDGTTQTSAMPSGIIVMWSGTTANIPSGWALCDGTSGTPNLSDRFIYGTTVSSEIGDTGGLTSHSHTVPLHRHGILYTDQTGFRTELTGELQVKQAQTGDPTVSIYNNHKHTSTHDDYTEWHETVIGSSDHLPPYYKLAYIMKL